MDKKFTCKICGCQTKTVIDSYKHCWIQCNDCNNVFRTRKNKYLIENLFPIVLAKRMLKKLIIDQLYPMQDVIEDEKIFYNYYYELSKVPIEKTKYDSLPAKFDSIFKKYNIDLSGKKVLDISGGPGYLSKYLKDKCKKIMVTEFSEYAVKGMTQHLGIEAVKFDYNKDKIDEVIKERFDIILIEYSINFCNDLDDFVRRLDKISAPGVFIYVSFVPPTLGCCLRWQHDEYTYNILYHPESMLRIFIQNGFSIQDRFSNGEYGFMEGLSWKVLLLRLPFILLYKLKALKKKNSINRELIQKNRGFIFRKSQIPD